MMIFGEKKYSFAKTVVIFTVYQNVLNKKLNIPVFVFLFSILISRLAVVLS